MSSGKEDEDTHIAIWKIKQLVKNLQAARGNGTSMISLIIPPGDQVSKVYKMLGDEYGTASNIKSRVNRLSVLGAITSTQARLKLYSKVPPNGLVMYCGTILTEDGKDKKVTIDFEPFRAINTSLYLCDNKFHTEALGELMADDDVFGFIVMDGNGCLYGTLCGNTRKVLHKFSVDLPKKHGRGGQSAARFARLRLEKRKNYVRKVAEMSTQLFIENDKANVKGIICAGSAAFKVELQQSQHFDLRLRKIVIQTVDVSYGGQNGFNQAIELSAACLGNIKFVHEKKLITQYFDEIATDSGKYCFGVKDTLRALEMSAIEKLIVYENLEMDRIEMKDSATGEEFVKYLTPLEQKDPKHFQNESGVDFDIVKKEVLVEWFAEHFKEFGASLEFITNKSQEGAQFVRGFGGLGGILRWSVDFAEMDGHMEEGDYWDDDDEDDYYDEGGI